MIEQVWTYGGGLIRDKRLIQGPTYHPGDHPHHAGSTFGVGDGTKKTPFPVVIGYEEWLTVCHISRGVSFLMHIAFHDGKRVALDRISRIVYKYRSLIVNDETRIAVG